jgi:hypothetical protein
MRRTILALVAVLSLTACGSKANPADTYRTTDPKTIAADATAALNKLSTVHLSGTVHLGSETSQVDLVTDKDGNATGNITIFGQKVEVISVGTHVFVRADAEFWKQAFAAMPTQAPAIASEAAGKWVKDWKLMRQIVGLISLGGVQGTVKLQPLAKASPTVIGTGDVNGTSAVQLQVADAVTGKNVTIYVAATDPHNILRIDRGNGDLETFDQFNGRLAPVAPTTGVVEYSALASK